MLAAASTQADVVNWANWTAGGPTGPSSFATGNIGAINLSYTGEIDFTQTNNAGTDFWRDGSSTPFAAYVSGSASNAPGTVDLVAVTGNHEGLNTVTFSQPVTNPYMAIVSLGQYGIGTTYYFDAPFIVDSVGQGYWGNGTLTNAGPNGLGGDTLVGLEGHGVIQFIGTFSSISFGSSNGEHWNGFTFGLATPTPASAALLGIAGLGSMRRRRP
jgi:MYXO-CTERM domain-containing protein